MRKWNIIRSPQKWYHSAKVLFYINNNHNNDITVPAAVTIIMLLLCHIAKYFLYIPSVLVSTMWTSIQTTALTTDNVPDLVISLNVLQ